MGQAFGTDGRIWSTIALLEPVELVSAILLGKNAEAIVGDISSGGIDNCKIEPDLLIDAEVGTILQTEV